MPTCSSFMTRGLFLTFLLPIVCATAGPADAQGASTYQMSCRHIGVAGSTLFANCRRMDGSFNRTSILIPGIENIDGVLRYQ